MEPGGVCFQSHFWGPRFQGVSCWPLHFLGVLPTWSLSTGLTPSTCSETSPFPWQARCSTSYSVYAPGGFFKTHPQSHY